MQGPALTLRGTSRQWSWHVSADFCRLFETGSNSDIKRVAFGRNSKQIKGWCKKNSIRTRHSLLQALNGQNATIKTSKADRKLFVTDFSPLGSEGSGGGYTVETASGSGDVRTTAAKCDVCECDLDGEKGDEGWDDVRCKELRQKLAHLCKEAENTRVQSL